MNDLLAAVDSTDFWVAICIAIGGQLVAIITAIGAIWVNIVKAKQQRELTREAAKENKLTVQDVGAKLADQTVALRRKDDTKLLCIADSMQKEAKDTETGKGPLPPTEQRKS